MESVTAHILARKIPLHSKNRPLFYMPVKSTVLDAAAYLDPVHFHRIESIYRNHEKVPLYTQLENDDIITYNLAGKSTISKQWLEYVHSGIARWRIHDHLNKKS